MNLMLDVLMMSFHFGEYVKYFFIKCFSWAGGSPCFKRSFAEFSVEFRVLE